MGIQGMKPKKKSEIESASPPNPAKENDRRFAEYRRKFGDKCWELDALAGRYPFFREPGSFKIGAR
jgi:hypothetical protein